MNVSVEAANRDYLVKREFLVLLLTYRLTSPPVRRVNWIRARSRMDRWTEEVLLLESEMAWYVNFMSFHQSRSENWARLELGDGHKAFALRDADMWRRYNLEGRTLFHADDGVRNTEDLDLKQEEADDGDCDPEESFE